MTHSTQPANDSLTGPLLLDLPTVGHLLGLSKWTLYELIQSGDLPSIKLRSRRLVARADLEDYVAGLQRRGATR